ncbi:uncharacterized protein LOC144445212 [Glandiceps talaboti]
MGSVVRLTNGQTPFEGRVEIFVSGVWGTICGDDHWDFIDAEVVCRELGFPGAMHAVSSNGETEPGSDQRRGNVECCGHENSILDCDHNVTCNSGYEDAGVYCIYPGYAGCFTNDDETGSTLEDITIGKCLSHCRDNNKLHAALQQDMCRCTDELPNTKTVPNEQCGVVCSGDDTQICGGMHFDSIYKTSLGACGGNLAETDNWVMSPGFPDNYPNRKTCEWTLENEDENLMIEVVLKMLYIINRLICSGDTLSFYNIEGRSGSPVKLTETMGVVDYKIGIVAGQSMRITFRSGWFCNDQGFAVFYRVFYPGQCEDKNWCQNNGTCYREDDTDICDCQEGWKGETCENEIDVCLNYPCQNNGTCHSMSNGVNDTYFCMCTEGYIGKNCEYIESNFSTTPQPEKSTKLTSLNIKTTPSPSKTPTFQTSDHSSIRLRSTRMTGTSHSFPWKHQTTTIDIKPGEPDRNTKAKAIGGIIGGSVIFVIAVTLFIIAIVVFHCRRRYGKSLNEDGHTGRTLANACYEDSLEVHVLQPLAEELRKDISLCGHEESHDVYYSTIDKQNVTGIPENNHHAQSHDSMGNKANTQAMDTKRTNNDTFEGFTENVAYEPTERREETDLQQHQGKVFVKNPVCDDNNGKGFVDNVVYEATDDVSNQDTKSGFVDNIVYEGL